MLLHALKAMLSMMDLFFVSVFYRVLRTLLIFPFVRGIYRRKKTLQNILFKTLRGQKVDSPDRIQILCSLSSLGGKYFPSVPAWKFAMIQAQIHCTTIQRKKSSSTYHCLHESKLSWFINIFSQLNVFKDLKANVLGNQLH